MCDGVAGTGGCVGGSVNGGDGVGWIVCLSVISVIVWLCSASVICVIGNG